MSQPDEAIQSLPEFGNPPLQEVAISVQFEPLERLVVPEIGLLWSHYGDRFVHVEQHPPLEPVIERTGVQARPAQPSIQFTSNIPLPRIWFLNSDKSELLQIQQDRFIRNWRKQDSEQEYPRYESHIRPKFLEDYEDFSRFISESGIGEIRPNQCEITYVNHITPTDRWTSHSQVDELFTLLSNKYRQTTPYPIEDCGFKIRHQILDVNMEFVGRLYITAEPAYLVSDDIQIYKLQLVARGKPLSRSLDGIMAFLDLGREYIVRSFAYITSTEMHKSWGRYDKGGE